MKPKYNSISNELQNKIQEDRKNHVVNPYAFMDENVVRRNMNHDRANLWRPAFVRDIEKIIHVPYYNRYSDKTQVFSLYRNDDITRRSQHVQLVSRIARNIGRMLGLNLDLIEAISLGHDIGHTPFGHAGEKILSSVYHDRTGRFFNHNVHSVRVLDRIFPLNLSLETLDGILCHNGELELQEYRPIPYKEFSELDNKVECCYKDNDYSKILVPATLEGCVMRISDIIAYLGKDRQDAERLGIMGNATAYSENVIGRTNAEIINNMSVNIIENSYGKNYISMSPEYFEDLSTAKKENYELIYGNKELAEIYEKQIEPMIIMMYEGLIKDVHEKGAQSCLYRYHVSYLNEINRYVHSDRLYEDENLDDIIVDFIASMTDDYFIDLFSKLYPNSEYGVKYKGYFDME